MKLTGYTYIQHKIKQRPWGLECQFTVARADGSHINEVIGLPDDKADLVPLIQARCEMVDASIEDIPGEINNG